MHKWILALISSVSLADDYICVLEDSESGQLYEISATLQQKNECTECSCMQVPVECLWGPDSYGNFTHQKNALKSVADSCDRASCICSTHGTDFLKVAEDRVSNAYDKIEKARDEAEKEQNKFLGISLNEINQDEEKDDDE